MLKSLEIRKATDIDTTICRAYELTSADKMDWKFYISIDTETNTVYKTVANFPPVSDYRQALLSIEGMFLNKDCHVWLMVIRGDGRIEPVANLTDFVKETYVE